MKPDKVTIVTRESPLAMRQTEWVKAALQQRFPELTIHILGMTTQGDQRLDVTLSKIGGKGLFVKELDNALLAHEADFAVHSMKDVPVTQPDGLVLAAITERESPYDAFVSNQYASVDALPRGAKVGTSSLRRQLQLLALRPDLVVESVRGNLQTRLKKCDEGAFDALILAEAGLKRMGLSDRIRTIFTPDNFLPSAGQGALGLACRADDEKTKKLLLTLHDVISGQCVLAERAVTRQLEGGCTAPVAAFATCQGEELTVTGCVAGETIGQLLRATVVGKIEEAEALGMQCAEQLIAQGAKILLKPFLEIK